MRTWMLVLSVLSVPFTLTHAVEDFSEGIPAARFGLAVLPAAFLLSLGYMAQVAAAALSARGDVRGDALNLLLALGWLVAAAADHLGEILFVPTGAYRAGLVSKALEVGIMLTAALWAFASVHVLRAEKWRKALREL
jgi:hypothetical protein